MGKKRGIGIPFLITYIVLLILVVSFMPGIVSFIGNVLTGYNNTSDPSYVVLAAFPFILLALYIFKPLIGGNS